MDIMETAQQILSVCGAISIVGGALAVIHRWVSPAFDLKDRVEVLEEHDKRDYEALKKIRESDSLILEVLLTLLDAQMSGDNQEELKKTREKLISHLSKRQT